jgi:peptidoglycan L-alanyl-D-glutamate endopeptidase CwlK
MAGGPFQFSELSLKKLAECHPNLQRIAHELIREMDVSILCGHRNEKDQNSAFINGRSKLQWPRSKHNMMPSHAMDVVPYPVDWDDIPRFVEMAFKIEKIARRLNIKIRLGRDFPFKDWPHVELVFEDKPKK